MKNILIVSSIAALLCTSTSSADTLGTEVGYAAWNTKLTGNIRKGSDSFDFEDELGYGSHHTNGFLWAYVDHPVPLIPNLKIQATNFSDSGTGSIQTSKTFNGKTLNAGSLSSSINFDQIDVIPYWRILDNWVNLDLGLNLKIIDGDISMTDNTSTIASTDLTTILPMLYVKARFDMPFTGLSVETDVSYISLAGNHFSDVKAGVVYESSLGLGATAGYRLQNITLDDIDNTYGKMDIKGIYAGLFFHF